jgi:cobalamin biosynthesis Mg chelatase CobN
MRRAVLLVMAVALATLVFAPVAMAQDDNPGVEDRGMDDRGFDDNGGGARTFDDNPGADDVAASPAASASAASAATAGTASATATATATATARAESGAGGDDDVTASVGDALPNTGGPSPVALMSAVALVLLVCLGLVATRLVRAGR